MAAQARLRGGELCRLYSLSTGWDVQAVQGRALKLAWLACVTLF